MAIGKEFPVSEYYRDNIIDGYTLSRVGTWWSAVLVIKDPRSEKNILNVYQWQLTDGAWKVRKNFSFKKQKDLEAFIASCQEFAQKYAIG